MKKGLLIVFSGPSGVGKGTILKKVMSREELKLCYSISMTTRKPREGEVDGVNYFFVTRDEFMAAVEKGELLEHAEFVSNCYGTPKAYVEKKREEGMNVVLEIEVQGALQIMDICPDALSIFIAPPSIEELESRIRGRGTEDEETIIKRVSQAARELSFAERYSYTVVNDDLEKAIENVSDIIRKHMTDEENEENA